MTRPWWYPTAFLLFLAIGPARLAWSFVRSLRTRHPIRMFVEAPAVAPSAYVAAMIESATADHAFAWRTAGVHAARSTMHATLLRSPDGGTLATILDGTPANGMTVLRSRFADGSALLTGDVGRLANLDRGTRVQLLLHADFAELWRLHAATLAERQDRVDFPIDVGWDDVTRVSEMSVARLVDAGRARFADGGRTDFRYTWRGAFLATVWSAVQERFPPHPADRRYRPRPGAGGPPATSTPLATAAIVDEASTERNA